MQAPCRHCGAPLEEVFVDLGMSPIANDNIPNDRASAMEPFFPLTAMVCGECFLVQLLDYEAAENMFDEDYAYFSSYSTSWLEHARLYVEAMTERLGLDEGSKVVELASNDGYLLQYFREREIPVLGVEPTASTAAVAREKGIPTVEEFFGVAVAERLAEEGQADLLLGNNVLAHVPDIQDFVKGLSLLLSPTGVLTMEFPHLLRLIEGNQYDTIYHEHFSYLSLAVVKGIFAGHGLRVFDVQELSTHGGSLRVFACHEASSHETTPAVQALLEVEDREGLTSLEAYAAFRERVINTKNTLLEFLIQARREGKKVAAYGAPGKGNTLLNYCGIREDLIAFAVDRNPFKHGRFCPGTHIPIFPVDKVDEEKPDYLVILPWNLTDEIVKQMAYTREWGCKFVRPIPEVTIID